MAVAEEQGLLTQTQPMKGNPKRRKSYNYCRFHQDRGHKTDECIQHKVAIKTLFRKGHLEKFVEEKKDRKNGGGYENQRKGKGKARPIREADRLIEGVGVRPIIETGVLTTFLHLVKLESS